MKRFFIIFLCLSLIGVPAMSVASAIENLDYSIDYTSNMVHIGGSLASTVNGGVVTLHVFYPEKGFEEIAADGEQAVAWSDQTTAVNGQYDFSFMLETSGVYTAYLGSSDFAQRKVLSVSFVSKAENRSALAALNDAADVSFEAFSAVMTEKKLALGFNIPLYALVDQQDVAKRMYDVARITKFNVEDGTSAVKIFSQMVVLTGLSQSKVATIADYQDIMGITSGEMKDWYANAIVTADRKAGVTKRISGQSIADMAAFRARFQEALIMEIIQYPGGFGNVKSIMVQYSDKIGINTAGVSDGVYQQLAGNHYADYTALKNAFNAAKESSSSSTGTGGGGSSGGGTSITLPAQPTESENAQSQVEQRFRDLGAIAWAQEAILTLAERKIISGVTADTFAPEESIKREEFVKLLVALFQVSNQAETLPFTDVAQGDWFYPYIRAAYASGISRGVSSTLFGAGQFISRQDMVVMVENALKARGVTLTLQQNPADFTDQADIADYAKEAVLAMRAAGVLNGDETGAFLPQKGTTRAEAATLIYQLLRYADQEV